MMPRHRSPWLAGALLLLAPLLSCDAPSPDPSPSPPEVPPLGTWKLLRLDGRIETTGGGTPVICLEGRSTRWPAPVDGRLSPLSDLQLLDDGRLSFRLAFEAESSPPGEAASAFELIGDRSSVERAQAPPGVVLLRRTGQTFARWSWEQRILEARFELEEARGGPARSSRLELTLDGRFESPSSLSGTWTLREESFEAGDCWSRSEGQGRWQAVPPLP